MFRGRSGGRLSLPLRGRIKLYLLCLLKGVPCTDLFTRLWLWLLWLLTYCMDIEKRRCRVSKSVCAPLPFSNLKPSLPRPKVTPLRSSTLCSINTSCIRTLVEGEVKIEVEIVPYGLPNTCPVGRRNLVAVPHSPLLTTRTPIHWIMWPRCRSRGVGRANTFNSTLGVACFAEPVAYRYII